MSGFKELGLIDILVEACESLNFKKPTPIQSEAIPPALKGRDILGFAATGSGKTAAFVLPILQALYAHPQPLFGCVVSPTRELAMQTAQQIRSLGESMGVKVAVIIGGEDQMHQAIALSKMPHIIVATPGRLLDHLKKTKGFHLRRLKYLVLDEADRLLDMEFKKSIGTILHMVPKERRTFLFSATPSKDVEQLQRASLQDPVRISVSDKITTVETLLEYYVFVPLKHKDATLVWLLNNLMGKSTIIFVNTKDEGTRLPLMLKELGFSVVPINGNMPQPARIKALEKFKIGSKSILVATNVAARGLDIPEVDVVINYSVPDSVADYVHRVGRTARAGRSGKAITICAQYDVVRYTNIEKAVHGDKKLPEYVVDKEVVTQLAGSIDDAQRKAKIELAKIKSRTGPKGVKRKRDGSDEDD